MLWLPTKQWRRATARLTRRRRGRRLARLLIWNLIIFSFPTASVLPQNALEVQIAQATRPYQFDFFNWETEAVTNELGRRMTRLAWGHDQTEESDVVRQFLQQEQKIAQLQQKLHKLYATPFFCFPSESGGIEGGCSPTIYEQETILNGLERNQTKLIPYVEAILTQQSEAILHEAGFTLNGQVFPPVAFRLIEPPTFLIISRRDRIERTQSLNLLPGLTDSQRTHIEDTLNQRGDISSYVTNIGGLGSYPTMVVRYGYLPYLADTIIHEWTHNYLFMFPTNMAWGYDSYPKLRTINETTASLVGQELSRRLIERYYPEWVKDLPPLDKQGQPRPAKPSEYQLTMRRIRQRVDDLLAAGQIEEAEQFMETERQQLVKQGQVMRRLNQAYFAFHGAYTLSPASVDPTGQQLRQLRAQSPTLKAFLDQVGWLNSEADYNDWLQHDGVK